MTVIKWKEGLGGNSRIYAVEGMAANARILEFRDGKRVVIGRQRSQRNKELVPITQRGRRKINARICMQELTF